MSVMALSSRANIAALTFKAMHKGDCWLQLYHRGVWQMSPPKMVAVILWPRYTALHFKVLQLKSQIRGAHKSECCLPL